MLKKTAFCLMTLALLLSGTSLQAQKDVGFSITAPSGSYEVLPEDFKLDLPNAADLSAAELEAALQRTCGGETPEPNDPTFCAAWTGPFCTGQGFAIPCGYQLNGAFGSLSTGCTTTYGLIGTQWYQFVGFPDNTCLTPNDGSLFSAVACTTP